MSHNAEFMIYGAIWVLLSILWLVMLVGGGIGCMRTKRWGLLMQGVGAGVMFMNVAVGAILPVVFYFMGTSSPVDTVRVNQIVSILLSGVGMVLLAGGFLLEVKQLVQGSKKGAGFPVSTQP